MSNELPLGGWEADRAAIEGSRPSDRGDAADLDETLQFRVYVARLIRRRENNSSAEHDLPAAFVLVSPDEYSQAKAGRVQERLIHSGARRLTGRIHFVTAAATSSVVEEYGSDDAALFKRLEVTGYNKHPTLIYVPQHPQSSLSYYPNGTADDTGVIDLSVGETPVSEQSVMDVMDAVHQQELVTPDGGGPFRIWHDAQKGLPREDAEQRVQHLVRIGLVARFTACSIRPEQPGKVGRTDLEIVGDKSVEPGKVTHHAVLEFKVLRSRGETGNVYSNKFTDGHVKEGVEQAFSYGKNKNTKLQMLCCFDMRDEDVGSEKTFKHVETQAQTLTVLLRRWFMYRTSEAYRAAQAANVA